MFAIRRSLICCFILLAVASPAAARTTRQAYSGDRLAYAWGGKLYVGFPRARLVPGPGIAARPAFSHDGQWLAFLRGTVNPQLWLARADGSAPRRVPLMLGVAAFQWSPTADVLAAQPIAAKGQAPISLVSPRGATRVIAHHLSGSFLWSPNGQTLAVADTSPTGYTQLDLVHGNAVKSYPLPAVGPRDPLLRLEGWWPGANGVLYSLDPGHCESCIADGTTLLDYNLRTGKVRSLGVTLPYHDWLATSRRRLLIVKGNSRAAFFGKHLQLCLPAGPCRALPGSSRGQISFDPAWSSTGRMAFVVAPAWHTYGFQSNARYRQWLDGHVLWTAGPGGSNARPVKVGVPTGIEDPEWTRDGRGILFVKGGALWLDPHLGAANAHPIARLVPAGAVPNYSNPAYQGWYYGHMDWHSRFAWY